MDYFLGPAKLLDFISADVLDRRATDLALHTTEATLALQNAGETSSTYVMQTTCDPLPILDYEVTPS
jgi:hypothetical protein